MNIAIKGIDINYEITGSGEDVLFLHGWGASLESFAAIIKHLSPRFRCIALDMPGCGKTSLPSEPLDIDAYCCIIKQFTEKLSITPKIVIGHSNGARVALHMCADGLIAPDKLVLFGAAGIKGKKTFRQKMRQLTFKTAKRILTLPVIKNHTQKTLDSLRAYYGSADYNSAPPVMRSTLVKLINSDVTAKLNKITASTLLIWGENDTATPLYMAKIMEKSIPDCGLCTLDDCDHWCFVQRPAQVNSILSNFL